MRGERVSDKFQGLPERAGGVSFIARSSKTATYYAQAEELPTSQAYLRYVFDSSYIRILGPWYE